MTPIEKKKLELTQLDDLQLMRELRNANVIFNSAQQLIPLIEHEINSRLAAYDKKAAGAAPASSSVTQSNHSERSMPPKSYGRGKRKAGKTK